MTFYNDDIALRTIDDFKAQLNEPGNGFIGYAHPSNLTGELQQTLGIW